MNKMMEKARQSGKRVRNAIKEFRGGSDELYQNLVTAVKINMCESDAAKKTRFVPPTDERAYTYDNGSCVRLANDKDAPTVDAYVEKLCEVKPNCHWADFDPWTDTSRLATYTKDKTMTPQEAVSKIQAYSNSVLVFAIPGIVLSVVSLFAILLLLLCRCCGACKPRIDGYTCTKKTVPVVFCVLFNAGLCVCAILAFFQREIALKGIADTFDGVKHTIHSASEWTFMISAPLESLRDTVLDATANISQAIQGLGGVGDDLDTFDGLLNAIAMDVNVTALPEGCDPDSDIVCIECGVCALIGDEVVTAETQINTNAEPAVVELEAVHEQVDLLLVDVAGEVRDEINKQVDMIHGVRGTLQRVQDQVDNAQGYFTKYKPAIAHAIRGVFSVAAIVGGFGLVGVGFGFSPLKKGAAIMHVAYFLGFLVLFMSFLVSAVALAMSILMGDTCEVVDMFSRNWTVPLGDYSGRIANACFQNESLIAVLGLEDKLAFARGGITFPNIDVVNSTDFSQLTTLSDTVRSTTADDAFPASGLLNASIATLNSLTGQTEGLCTPGGGNYVADDTILTPWNVTNDDPSGSSALEFMVGRYHPYDSACSASNPNVESFSCYGVECPFSVRIGQEYSETSSLYTVKVTSEGFVRRLQTDIVALVTFSAEFVTKIKDMVAAVYAVKAQLEATLLKDVDEFESVMYCRFVADGYADIFNALCGDVMPAITVLSLLLYLTAFLLVPVNVCLIVLARRLPARGSGPRLDKALVHCAPGPRLKPQVPEDAVEKEITTLESTATDKAAAEI